MPGQRRKRRGTSHGPYWHRRPQEGSWSGWKHHCVTMSTGDGLATRPSARPRRWSRPRRMAARCAADCCGSLRRLTSLTYRSADDGRARARHLRPPSARRGRLARCRSANRGSLVQVTGALDSRHHSPRRTGSFGTEVRSANEKGSSGQLIMCLIPADVARTPWNDNCRLGRQLSTAVTTAM